MRTGSTVTSVGDSGRRQRQRHHVSTGLTRIRSGRTGSTSPQDRTRRSRCRSPGPTPSGSPITDTAGGTVTGVRHVAVRVSHRPRPWFTWSPAHPTAGMTVRILSEGGCLDGVDHQVQLALRRRQAGRTGPYPRTFTEPRPPHRHTHRDTGRPDRTRAPFDSRSCTTAELHLARQGNRSDRRPAEHRQPALEQRHQEHRELWRHDGQDRDHLDGPSSTTRSSWRAELKR